MSAKVESNSWELDDDNKWEDTQLSSESKNLTTDPKNTGNKAAQKSEECKQQWELDDDSEWDDWGDAEYNNAEETQFSFQSKTPTTSNTKDTEGTADKTEELKINKTESQRSQAQPSKQNEQHCELHNNWSDKENSKAEERNTEFNAAGKSEECKQQWELDDDTEWDDWGDAEDTKAEESPTPIPKNIENNAAGKCENLYNTKTENQTTQTRLSKQNKRQSSGWGSLFGGVVSSVLSTADGLTSTVSHGLDKVIGVPDPAEMARINMLEEAKTRENQQKAQQFTDIEERSPTLTSSAPIFGFGLVNNVTSLGSKVLNTGLDTLEEIGKKTMNILQENDPLLKNKIKRLGLEQDTPNISEILKEAKQENELLEQSLRELSLEKSRAQLRFEVLFENNCGLVHLEALEILSSESQLKIQALRKSLTGMALQDLSETLTEVKELIELEDLEGEPENESYDKDELNNNFKQAIEDVELQIHFDEIINLWSKTTEWLASEETKGLATDAIFAKGLTALAETCAYQMQKLHKIAELLLVKEHHSTANEVDGIVQLCKQFSMHLQAVANNFATLLSGHTDQNSAKSYINTLFTEMLQARKQIEKSYYLFIPILQIGAV